MNTNCRVITAILVEGLEAGALHAAVELAAARILRRWNTAEGER